MKVSAALKRAIVVVFVVLATHGQVFSSPTSSSEKSDWSGASGSDSYVADEHANSVAGRNIETASAITITKPSADAPGLSIEPGSDLNRITISDSTANTAGFAASDYKVTELSSPSRLVVDIFNRPNFSSKAGKEFDAKGAEMISKVRIGTHPDKSRIVFDLNEAAAADFNRDVSLKNGKIVISLSGAATSAGIKTSKASSAKESRASAETKTESVMDDGRPTLTALNIEAGQGKGNSVVASFDSSAEYNFKRTAPSEYVLTLNGASLDPNAAMTVLAPPGSGSIRSARAIAQGDNVLVRVFANPTASLNASKHGDKIMISAQNAPMKADEIRAQFAPEAAGAAKDASKGEAKVEESSAAKDASAAAEATKGGGDEDSELSALLDDEAKFSGRLISLDLQDTDIDNALRIIAEVSNLNIIASEDVTGKVTLQLIDVPWDQALDVILKTNGLDKVQEGNVIRIAPVEKLRAEQENLRQVEQAKMDLEPLNVKYIRVSYAKASDLKPLVETVISERGSVSYDERTNQIIVKDIKSGVRNVAELVTKLDLRTPQVLLETQIVEAQRTLARDLGAELGFTMVNSPATGNALPYNFPNSVNVGGSVTPGSTVGSSFPAAISSAAGSAVSILLDSADGSKSVDARISSLEEEGRLRVISRPAVATTNNTQAMIKSVEKIRVKVPSGGLSVATGQGASAGGNSNTATEIIEIGITLEVTPQASPDYYVLLDINAKSSTFGSREVDGIPSEVERSSTSTVLVSSGQTFALGGIYKISDKDTVSGVPFLKDVPVLGHLFRNSGVDNADEELIFFITPRIIEGSFDDAAMRVAG